jgi:hypothetical protein
VESLTLGSHPALSSGSTSDRHCARVNSSCWATMCSGVTLHTDAASLGQKHTTGWNVEQGVGVSATRTHGKRGPVGMRVRKRGEEGDERKLLLPTRMLPRTIAATGPAAALAPAATSRYPLHGTAPRVITHTHAAPVTRTNGSPDATAQAKCRREYPVDGSVCRAGSTTRDSRPLPHNRSKDHR